MGTIVILLLASKITEQIVCSTGVLSGPISEIILALFQNELLAAGDHSKFFSQQVETFL